MTQEATRGIRYSDLVKEELFKEHGFCRQTITANESSAQDYVIGHVLGEVTASGKYKISVKGAGDGSENAAAICVQNKSIPASTDTDVVVMYRGPAVVADESLTFDGSYSQTQKETAYDTFESNNIKIGQRL